jgi:hypothetical protein
MVALTASMSFVYLMVSYLNPPRTDLSRYSRLWAPLSLPTKGSTGAPSQLSASFAFARRGVCTPTPSILLLY